MKCPKCGYHSFDHLDSCKRCNQGLAEHKEKFNLRGFFFPGQPAAAEVAAVVDESDAEEEPSADGSVDFGFDFLDEEANPAGGPSDTISLNDDKLAVNIDQPFGADSETIPADTPATTSVNGSKAKSNKGPEFSF